MTPPPPAPRAAIREWDRRAIEELGIPGIVLMENAASGCARVLGEIAAASGRFGPPYRIICGPGNNGGDGAALARHLHNRGVEVSIHLVEPRGRIDPASEAGINFRIVERMGLPLLDPADPAGSRSPGEEARRAVASGTIVDAMLGTGLTRPLGPPYLAWVEAVNASGRPVVAIDIPTGLDADTGRVLGAAVRAEHTVTMAAPKLGFHRGEGPAHTGTVHVVDIGIPPELMESPPRGGSGAPRGPAGGR